MISHPVGKRHRYWRKADCITIFSFTLYRGKEACPNWYHAPYMYSKDNGFIITVIEYGHLSVYSLAIILYPSLAESSLSKDIQST